MELIKFTGKREYVVNELLSDDTEEWRSTYTDAKKQMTEWLTKNRENITNVQIVEMGTPFNKEILVTYDLIK